MSHNRYEIKDGAIFVADVHFNPNRREFLNFLFDIKNSTLEATQLFLMGDIFDFLAGEIEYFKNQNKELIELINELSQTLEIFYFEGNHDYNLATLFPNLKVFKREMQPIIFLWDDKKVALSHGDIFTPFGYNLYTAIIRNHLLLVFLNAIDRDNWLTKKIDFWLRGKNLSHIFNSFEDFAIRRLGVYKNNIDANIFIEGHFHQGRLYEDTELQKLYFNLPSFGVEHSYMMIQKKEFLLACYI
ncbi:MAG: UDP-2,3-diacylglucosamine diphosphatase [Arcobacteraceae bacterium]|nr:UDP-2,3-diacylglucosamine diphosphatase [Arcobacteraceae bacterium]